MNRRIRKALVTAGVGGALLAGSAVPAHASVETHCPHQLTVSEVVECACIITATNVDAVLPGWTEWDCSNDIPI